MVELKSPGTALRDIIDIYKTKIESGILPPDPARIIEFVLRIPVEVEHVLPIPPIAEYVHTNFTHPMIESLPRLPLTSDFHEFEWLRWFREEFRV